MNGKKLLTSALAFAMFCCITLMQNNTAYAFLGALRAVKASQTAKAAKAAESARLANETARLANESFKLTNKSDRSAVIPRGMVPAAGARHAVLYFDENTATDESPAFKPEIDMPMLEYFKSYENTSFFEQNERRNGLNVLRQEQYTAPNEKDKNSSDGQPAE